MNESEFAELAAGHSLGALSAEDERRYRAALSAHPEWAGIVEDDADTAALLAEGAAPVAPPPALRDALLARIAATPQDPSGDAAPADATPAVSDRDGQATAPQASAGAPARRPRRLLFALAACLVLIVGLGAGAAVVIPQLLRPAAVVALDRIENAPDAAQKTVVLPSGGRATAHWSASIGTAVLVSDGLEPLDGARTYELWFVRGDTPVSAGTFAAEQGTTTAQLRGSMHAGDAIAVTVEPAGGSPTGKPTTQPIVVIPTS
ncbi:Anti-sigma-K factor RskA [Microbacterium sp. 8M]|uniref:anti-sigma factor n=1 Tax=Microbacterium sp. 8M TaxID=2653153 RepID=UPI0012F2BD77|nr:anti-sigma factor [Microbacterium sp. 8M]VXA98133.1 Anti-sigma-K factor RskA [Microbacterium sp. 8M]